jgi:opacity protein-like surface antigen
MRKTILGVAAVLAMSGALATSASAQAPVAFGVKLGATVPLGDLSDGFSTGWHGGVVLGFMPAMVPFGVRLEGDYHKFASEDDDLDADLTIMDVILNGVWGFAMPGSPMQPYAIGGIGFYNSKMDGDDVIDDESTTDFGVNVGGGVRFALSGFSAFVEARWHNIFTEGNSTNMVPISFGITFR